MNSLLRLIQSTLKSAMMLPTRMPLVNHLNSLVTSVMDWQKCSTMGRDSIPIGASMQERAKYVRNDTGIMATAWVQVSWRALFVTTLLQDRNGLE
jgi:hypothetical protein